MAVNRSFSLIGGVGDMNTETLKRHVTFLWAEQDRRIKFMVRRYEGSTNPFEKRHLLEWIRKSELLRACYADMMVTMTIYGL